MYSKFSSNSEAVASELLENHEDMSYQHYPCIVYVNCSERVNM